jgi:hypothetical protein
MSRDQNSSNDDAKNKKGSSWLQKKIKRAMKLLTRNGSKDE